MAIAKTRIHIICGICGSKEYMTYKINRDELIINEAEDNEYKKDSVTLICNNCSSITGLEELMDEELVD